MNHSTPVTPAQSLDSTGDGVNYVHHLITALNTVPANPNDQWQKLLAEDCYRLGKRLMDASASHLTDGEMATISAQVDASQTKPLAWGDV